MLLQAPSLRELFLFDSNKKGGLQTSLLIKDDLMN